MKIVVFGSDPSFAALKACNDNVDWVRAMNEQHIFETKDADGYFNLSDKPLLLNNTGKPYFINSVSDTLSENGTIDTIRINGWNGFLAKETWEISGDINEKVKTILFHLNKKTIVLPDEPGFISARVIAMIINEAYYALGEKVSTVDEINIAMKSGTNYPHGPFEWAGIIGLKNIYRLLQKLALADRRYTVAALLEQSLNNNS